MRSLNKKQKDRFLGALYGLAIGDALGAVHEFKNSSPKVSYTGIITDKEVTVNFRWQTKIISSGSITDDTEMTLVLLKSILKNKEYDRDDVLLSYMRWANTKDTSLGKNTRALFKGVKTVKGYERRRDNIEMKSNEGNGSLMRTLPLILLEDYLKFSKIDVSLTNKNPVNIKCSNIYLDTLSSLIFEDVDSDIRSKIPSIRKAISDAKRGNIRDISGKDKGWVVHALYVTLFIYQKLCDDELSSYEEGIDLIGEHFLDSDTDTVMAIAGAVLGARFGYKNISQEYKTKRNIKKIQKYFEATERPFIISDELIEKINDL